MAIFSDVKTAWEVIFGDSERWGAYREASSEREGVKAAFSPPAPEVDRLDIKPFDKRNLGPVGFDLTVGTTIIEADILTKDWRSLNGKEHKLKEGQEVVLKPDEERRGRKIYYVFSHERFYRPSDLDFLVDSKSTTGRVGCMCHQLRNGFSGFHGNREGNIVLAVQPYMWPIKVTAGKTKLAQVVLRRAGTGFFNLEQVMKMQKEIRIFVGNDSRALKDYLRYEGVAMTFSLDRVYEAIPNDKPIDMDAKGEIKPEKYWRAGDEGHFFRMKPDRLYLFGSKERIRLGKVCGRISREHEESGTGLWGHFAGFIQPGYDGEITFECWSGVVRDISAGDVAGIVLIDGVDGEMEVKYEQVGSYQGQKAPKLPRMFRDS